MELHIAQHYESRISTFNHPEHGLVIKKHYKADNECIQWLNSYLGRFYTNKKIMPVVAHEANILNALEPFGIVPKCYGYGKDCIYLEIAGNPITSTCDSITKNEYLFQAKNILSVFAQLGLKHNDLLEGNLLLHDGILKVIDFTLAEFKGIETSKYLPDRGWARINLDHQILLYDKYFQDKLSADALVKNRNRYKEVAQSVYNYHNLGVGHYNEEMKEKTPYGYGERYNFDRFSMMVQQYDFTGKNIFDVGCNSGWFCFQSKMIGANTVLGIDFTNEGVMGDAFRYAFAFEAYLQAGVYFVNQKIEYMDCSSLLHAIKIEKFDAVFVLSVLHHVKNVQVAMKKLFDSCQDVIFYEDHEFWNALYDDNKELLHTEGHGHRYDWNKDASWQRKMASLEYHEPLVLDSFMNSWRKKDLLLDQFSSIKLLGFSEKRRPLLALYK